jgi:hypothetical protein
MNVYELDAMTLQFIRRPVTDEFREEYAPLFLAAYNEMYRMICTRFYKINPLPHRLENPTPMLRITSEEENEKNTPVFPESYHYVLSLYAAYTWMYAEEKYAEANFYYTRAMTIAGELEALSNANK